MHDFGFPLQLRVRLFIPLCPHLPRQKLQLPHSSQEFKISAFDILGVFGIFSVVISGVFINVVALVVVVCSVEKVVLHIL